MQLRLLRLFLGLAAITWGVSVIAVFLPWPTALQAFQQLGAESITYDRMLDYWLRMAAGAYALLGCWYVVMLVQPQKYFVAIPWFGWLMIVEGVILLVHGLRLSLPPFPFYADVSACLIAGAGILFFARHAKPAAA